MSLEEPLYVSNEFNATTCPTVTRDKGTRCCPGRPLPTIKVTEDLFNTV